MRRSFKILRFFLISGFAAFVLGLLAVGGVYLYVAPDLPDVSTLQDVRLQVPLRVYTRDGRLMAVFGEKRRIPITYDDLPQHLVDAFLAAEDDRFFEHPGVDWQGLARAFYYFVKTGGSMSHGGGSTITMQVARNYLLTLDRTYIRKIREIFLALKIDRELTKQQILALYLNKINLGNRAYGVGAAAEVYYGTDIGHLSLAQMAMLAGLPKAPSRDNPLANPKAALDRRGYVLGRMHDLGYITDEEFQTAMAEPVTATYHGPIAAVHAPYLAEMVRADMVSRYGDAAYTEGYQVVTTLDSRLQPIAVRALRKGVMSYDRRHGYRGPAGHVDLPQDPGPADMAAALQGHDPVANLVPAVVASVSESTDDRQWAVLMLRDDSKVTLDWDAMGWAAADRKAAPDASKILKTGDIVYLEPQDKGGYVLAQIPDVQAAVISLDPLDDAIVAMAGGFDFSSSKFNRVMQAERQPGSAFKPFIYTAALAHGYSPATIVNDAPVVFADKSLGSVWRPENYSGKFFGPTRLREALVHSRNLVSIRVLRDIGIPYALNYLKNFGLDPDKLPHNLSLALGSVALSPVQMARGYSVIANGGHLTQPYYIQTIYGPDGQVLEQADPALACDDCRVTDADAPADSAGPVPVARTESKAAEDASQAPPAADDDAAEKSPGLAVASQIERSQPVKLAPRTVDTQVDYLITTMMRDVINRGTGRHALTIGRHDLAGKTGTTNDYRDAWFSGFNDSLVTTAWVGFDQVKSLGWGETGAGAALPIWIDFMGPALKNVPEVPLNQPSGIVTVKIDPATGLRVGAGHSDAMFEVFRGDNLPAMENDQDKKQKDQTSPQDIF